MKTPSLNTLSYTPTPEQRIKDLQMHLTLPWKPEAKQWAQEELDELLNLKDSDRWNPDHFGEAPKKEQKGFRLPDNIRSMGMFWDESDEPPEPDDFPSLAAYEKAWSEWESKQ